MAETNSQMQKSYFDVLGICCSSEIPLVENIVNSLPGVKECSVVVTTRTVIVVHDSLVVSQLQIVKALNQARLEANVRVNGGDADHKRKWPSPYSIGSGVLLVISLFSYIYHPLQWVALGAVAIGIFPILLKGFASAMKFRIDITVLAIIAVVGTIVLGDYIEAATIVFLFSIAEWLEARAGYKAHAIMSSLMSIAPQKAVLADTGEEVDVDDVKLSTILAVKAGEVVPIDGIVVDGKCEVDEKTLTGESFPVMKDVGARVYAGTINLDGYINVKTTVMAEDCVVAKMTKLVEEAQSSKSKTQRFIDKCSQYYTPAIIIASAGIALAPLIFITLNRSYWFHLALVVLVGACPCALILSTPVATFCALTRAATSGMLIKGGEYLETLAKIKVIGFDKTGTLTRGEFIVNNFESLSDDFNKETLLYWVSSIESKSSHPMASALVDYARSLSIEPSPENVMDFQNFPGEGIHGKIDGKIFFIGNRKLAVRAGSEAAPEDGHNARGRTVGYMYLEGKPIAIFGMSDECRTGVKDALNELRQLSIKTCMLTGDSLSAAMLTQKELGYALDVVRAELLPEDKSRIIEALKKDGRTSMIGDGINDAPALATADIGISMGIAGSALAIETGQVILMSNDLRKVPKIIRLARKANRKIIENVFLSVVMKAPILALALVGHPLVWAAVLADVSTCLLVIFNSMLLLRAPKHHEHRSSSSSPPKKCCSVVNTCSSALPKCSEGNGNHHHLRFWCCGSAKESACARASYHIVKSDCSEHRHPELPDENGGKMCHVGEMGCSSRSTTPLTCAESKGRHHHHRQWCCGPVREAACRDVNYEMMRDDCADNQTSCAHQLDESRGPASCADAGNCCSGNARKHAGEQWCADEDGGSCAGIGNQQAIQRGQGSCAAKKCCGEGGGGASHEVRIDVAGCCRVLPVFRHGTLRG